MEEKYIEFRSFLHLVIVMVTVIGIVVLSSPTQPLKFLLQFRTSRREPTSDTGWLRWAPTFGGREGCVSISRSALLPAPFFLTTPHNYLTGWDARNPRHCISDTTIESIISCFRKARYLVNNL